MSDRKKAIETLKQLRLDYEEFYEEYNNEVTQAYDMAIASLETDEAYDLEYEQPEFCKNCIDREAVYYYISSHIHEIITESGTDKNAHTNAILRSLANGVKTMPSVLTKVTKNDLGADREDAVERLNALKQLIGYDKDSEIVKATQKSLDMAIKVLEQEPILEKINKMKSEIASSLEFWDYSPNTNPLARDILETVTHFWGDIRKVEE